MGAVPSRSTKSLDVMPNTAGHARRWTEFLARRAEIAHGELLLKHFESGRITRLCDCGCNTFDIEVPATGLLEPLCPAGRNDRVVVEMDFRTAEPDGTVSFAVFADSRGNLSSVEVDYCANSAPMPDEPRFIEPPFHVHGELKA
jgi:hypothetical protein